MKNVAVTINPTEIKSLTFNNEFTMKPGEKIALQVKSEAGIRLNNNNPVMALVAVKVMVEDPNQCIRMQIETVTGVVVSTFVDNLDQFIKEKYLPVIIMSANEKIRSVSAMMGIPIKIPNPRFGTVDTFSSNGLEQ